MFLLNIERVKAFLKLENWDKDPVRYINPYQYIQRNSMAEDKFVGVKDLFSLLPVFTEVNIVRFYLDEDFVFAHIQFDLLGPKIGFDVFRVEDGLIVEHLDDLPESDPLYSNRNSEITSTATITELDINNAPFPDKEPDLLITLASWTSQGVVMKYTTIHKGPLELMINEGDLTDIYAACIDLLKGENFS